VSLLPSATEILCALGGRELLVGRSHECDYPASVAAVPVLSRPRRLLPAVSAAIDREVRHALLDALSLYTVDIEALSALSPDVILTQDLCAVCAVSLQEVSAALDCVANRQTCLVSLQPTRLDHVWQDIRRVAQAIGATDAGEAVAAELQGRCQALAASIPAGERPSVLTIEWLDPVMIGATWMPELVSLAGGRPLVTVPGQRAPTLGLEELGRLDPDVVLIKPCGFTLPQSLREIGLLCQNLPWEQWRAVHAGQVFIADGNAFFNRSGPRLVDSLEILAACVHPRTFRTLRRLHADSVRRVTPELALVAFDEEP
jgi:iron complex transport system substrate-binding protein